ncbi:MAG: isochorismatase family protein [Streptosporangiaceae bacterium]
MSTSGCVRASATDAMQHGFRPIVIGEACGDRSAAIHQANLADLRAKYADIATISDACARFSGIPAGP